MKFKMRVLFFSKSGNTETMAKAISKEQAANCDQIPPAYPCEKEKLLIIGVETDKSAADKIVVDFFKDVTPQRAKNIAIFATSSKGFEAVAELTAIAKKNGVNVIAPSHTCAVKGGLFKSGKVTDADIKAVTAWANKVVNSLAE